jgi:membrane protease YdiL (CAAX protease family)
MRTHAIAIGKVLGFLVFALALGWLLARGVRRVVSSNLIVEGAFASAALATSWGAARLEGRGLASVGFAERAPARSLAMGVALGTLIVGGSAAIFTIFGWYEAKLGLTEPLVRWFFAALILSALVALFEETLFRGYALQIASRAFGGTSAIIGTGVLFGALHLLNPTPELPTWLKLVGCGCVAFYGMLAAIARLATNGLWLPVGIHFAWNLLEDFVFGFPDSGVASPESLLHATVSGPVLLTGGGYGPEGGLVMLVLAGVAIALIVGPKGGIARGYSTMLAEATPYGGQRAHHGNDVPRYPD